MRTTLFRFSSAFFVTAAVLAPAFAETPDPSAPVAPSAIAAPTLSVLSEPDKTRYARIFELQEDGNWKSADKEIAAIENDILMGYVLYQRYMHPTDYRSSYDELKRWMAYYADHPEASEIYSLAMKRRPKNASPPQRPVPRKWRQTPDRYDLHPLLQADYERTSRPRVAQIEGRVRYLCKNNEATTALKEIDRHLKSRTITERQYDRMRSWIAASLYYQGYLDTAEEIADEVSARNGETAVLAHWIGGLIAFRGGDMSSAFAHFNALAAAPYQEDSLRAAGGFWAARAALAADIRATRPDIVTLQELTSRNAPLVRDLRAEYPHQASCALVEWARVAILSRWPVEGEICLEGQGLVGIQVMSPDGPFWAFSLHAFWPWPHGQADQLNTILPMLGDLEEPVVIAGDFNMVPWSYALRSIERSIGGTRAGPLFSTLTKMGAPLPIDHVYAPGGGQAVARPLLGSDHSGVLAKVFVFDP